ncbi:hypothetical protein D3C86_1599690 [compost metagenome]
MDLVDVSTGRIHQMWVVFHVFFDPVLQFAPVFLIDLILKHADSPDVEAFCRNAFSVLKYVDLRRSATHINYQVWFRPFDIQQSKGSEN